MQVAEIFYCFLGIGGKYHGECPINWKKIKIESIKFFPNQIVWGMSKQLNHQ